MNKTTRRVFRALEACPAEHRDSRGRPSLSYHELAQLAGLARPTVANHMKKLQEHGYVLVSPSESKRGGPGQNTYLIQREPPFPLDEEA